MCSNPSNSQVKYLRRSGSQLKVFAPVSDLKLISQAGVENLEHNLKDVAIAGGQVVGDEWAEHVVKNRSGIILRTRSEAWHKSTYLVTDAFSALTVHSSSPINGFRTPSMCPIPSAAQSALGMCRAPRSMLAANLRKLQSMKLCGESGAISLTRTTSFGYAFAKSLLSLSMGLPTVCGEKTFHCET